MKTLALIRTLASAVVIGLLTVAVGGESTAAEVTPEMASRAVKNWRATRDAFGCKFGKNVASARRCEAGDAKFNVVKLEGGGFVVTSADTTVRPIIFFSDGEDVNEDPRSPLYALLKRDMAGAAAATAKLQAARLAQAGKASLASVKPGETSTGTTGVPPVETGSTGTTGVPPVETESTGTTGVPPVETENERLWAELLAEPSAATLAKVSTPSDIRVNKLVQSTWGQSTVGWSTKVFNYYTPNNYVCGCVATATAQIMRFHQYPTSSVEQFTNPNCEIDGVTTSLTSKGGTFDWSNMPLSPSSSIKTVQKEAIGKLTYDVGVSVSMDFASDGSGAFISSAGWALVNRFGYRGAVSAAWQNGNTATNQERTRRALITNFDAGLPVGLGVSGEGGHAIVGDGYGYVDSQFCCHLNMGWSGSDDGWYIPPDLKCDYNFNVIDDVLYNIFPTQDPSCGIVSGRVLAVGGGGASGVSVQALNFLGQVKATATTNTKGIFALFVAPGSYTIKVASGNAAVSASATVNRIQSSRVGMSNGNPSSSYYSSYDVCNAHVGDLQLESLAVASIGDVEYDTLAAACAAAQAGQTVQLLMDTTENITVSTGCTVDFQNHTLNGIIYCTFNQTSGTATFKNGTVTGQSDAFDGKPGSVDVFTNGKVVFENMTMTGTIWSDSHPLTFTSGTYSGAVRSGSQNCTINGGNFASLMKDGTGVFVVNGGRFSNDYSAICSIPDLSRWVNDGAANYPWTVKALERARIGTTTYSTFKAACAAAVKGDKVELLEDNAESPVIVVAGCTVDFGGYTFAGRLVCTNSVAMTLTNGRLSGQVEGVPVGTMGASGAITFSKLTVTGEVVLNRHSAIFADGTYGVVSGGVGAVVATNGCVMTSFQGEGTGQFKVYAGASVTKVERPKGSVAVYGGKVATLSSKTLSLSSGNVEVVDVSSSMTGTGGTATTVTTGSIRLSGGSYGTVTVVGNSVSTFTNAVVAAYVHASGGRAVVNGGKFGSFAVRPESGLVTIRGGVFKTKPTGEVTLLDGWCWERVKGEEYPWRLSRHFGTIIRFAWSRRAEEEMPLDCRHERGKWPWKGMSSPSMN